MDIKVTGRKMQVSDALRDYAIQKVEAACKVFEINPMTAEVVLHVEKNPSNPNSAVAEITLRTRGNVIRVEEAAPDMYEALDVAAEKTERRLRKYKTRVVDRKVRSTKGIEEVSVPDDLPPIQFDDDEEIVRVKEIEFPNLTEEEALVQMDLLGHDFFVYNDAVTGLTNVLYRRQSGGYGLIKPVIEQPE